MKVLAKRLSIALLLLVLLSIAALLFLVNTPAGLRVITSFAPDSMVLEGLDGSLNNFSVDTLTLNFEGGRLEAKELQLEWSLLGLLNRSFSVENVTLTKAELTLTETTQPSEEPYQPWAGINLPIDITINNARLNDVSAVQQNQPIFHLDQVLLVANVIDNIVTVDQLRFDEQDNSASLSGRFDIANVDNGEVELLNTVDWRVGENHLIFDGQLSGTWQQLSISQSSSSPLNAQITAEVKNTHSDLISWDASLNSFEPLERADIIANLIIESGTLTSVGEFSPSQGLGSIRASLLGDLNINYARQSAWSAEIELNFDGTDLSVNTLSLVEQNALNPGTINVNGVLEGLSNFADRTNSLGVANLKGHWSNLSVPLALEASNPAGSSVNSKGVFELSGLSSDFRISANADGVISDSRVNDTPFSSELDVRIAGQSVVVNNARLLSGGTSASASGKIDEYYALKWDVNSPNVADLLPGAVGDFISNGELLGPRDQPQIKLLARSNTLVFNDYQIQNLSVDVDASTGNQQAPLSATLKLKSLSLNNQAVVQNLSVDLSGTLAKHQLKINSTVKQSTSIAAQIFGSNDVNVAELNWQGRVAKLSVNNPEFGDWGLSDDVQIKLVGSEASISPSCLSNAEQSICFDASVNNGGQTANLKLTSLALARLNPLIIDYGLAIAGIIDGEFSYAKSDLASAAKVNGFIESANGELSWQALNEDALETKQLAIKALRFDFEQTNEPSVTGLVTLGNGSQLTAKLALSEAFDSPSFKSANLVGQVFLDINDLASLPPSLTADLPINGNLNAKLDLSGTWLKPEIVLNANVVNASAEVPELGLVFDGIEIAATTQDRSTITLEGKLKSGEGWLYINGILNLVNVSKPKIQLTIKGQSLTLANTGELAIVGGVDLKASIDDDLIDLNGSIELTSAEVDFKVPETAILASDDVVLIGAESIAKSIKQRIDLSIDLGSKTHILAQGLDANLVGRLRVTQKPGGLLRGEGQIDVVDGRYTAYNQDLKIDQGRLVFNGGSIDDPSLELRAQKTADDVTAGVQVSGRASAPILGLYSTPTMSDQDVLSVLIFNKRLGELGSQDGLVLLQIANSLRGDGQSNVSKITRGIQSKLGLTDLQVNLASSAPSIQAGKQLSSKFYVGYGYGLLNAAQTLILRYKLNRAWSIKADLGADSGADLRYQIER